MHNGIIATLESQNLLVQQCCCMILQLVLISRNTLTALANSDSESKLTFLLRRQTRRFTISALGLLFE